MSKQTIIDWQRDSVVMARGTGRGTKAALEAISFQAIGEDGDGRRVTAEEALNRASAELGGMKGDVTVVVSREVVEVRTLSVPRMDPDELPDVIRFQAQRQLANMTDSWALDYVMLPPTPGQEMQTALVAGISPAHLADIEKICTSVGLQVAHVALRPIEIARYAIDSGAVNTSGTTLIVCVAEQVADLMILRAGQVIQVRGTRLPSEPEQIASTLKGEIRRSLMAASSLLAGTSLDNVLLIATSRMADQLDGPIATVAEAPVTHLDPTKLLSSQLAGRDELANATAHRLAALAGAISLPIADKPVTLDLKNPKKRPPKKKNTGRILLYGGAATILLLGGFTWWLLKLRSIENEIALYQSQSAEKEEVVDWAESKIEDSKLVDQFLDQSPNWLDELTYISERIPPADKIILDNPTFSMQRDGTGVIRVNVRADESGSISEFETSLRDDHHNIKGSELSQVANASDAYQWRVVESIIVKGRGWNVGLSNPPASPDADAADDAETTDPAATDAGQAEETFDADTTSEVPAGAAEVSEPGADDAVPTEAEKSETEESPEEQPAAESPESPETSPEQTADDEVIASKQ